jgi:putative DNA primase/helicase
MAIKEQDQMMTTTEQLSTCATGHGLTDTYEAERLAELYSSDLRYDHQRGSWFIYRTHTWRQDRNGEIQRFAVDCARGLQQEATLIPDTTAREAILRFGKFCQSKPGISRVLSIAQNLQPFAITGEEWNRDPWLMGVSNGVVDLRNAELRQGQREDLVSLSLGVPYEPDADCPRWKRFVSEIFAGDETLVEYLQRVLGYTLTGRTTEQIWFLLVGDGANGKSTLLTVIGYVLGDYAKTVPFSMFELPNRSSVPDDVATLVDRRYVNASESIEAAKLNEARIKALTGSDRITARPLYGQWIEFEPQLKLFLSCNQKPKVADESHGFWRRVHVVPFNERFDGDRRDNHLTATLKAEASGVLNWILEGCLLWQVHGLMPPAAVLAATSNYEGESNPLSDFLAVRCEEGPSFETAAQELYDGYSTWIKSDRPTDTPLLMTAFGRWAGKRFTKQHLRAGNLYKGVRLRPTVPSA